MVRTLADFKRLGKGSKMVLLHAVDAPDHLFLNKVREVDIKQTNAVKFTGGSWLYYPKASGFKVNNGIVIIDDVLYYEVMEGGV